MSFLGDVWRAVKKTPLPDLIAAVEAVKKWIQKGKKPK